MPLKTTCFIFTIAIISCVCGDGYYTIVAPANIRPNSDFNAWVTLHNQTEPTTIQLSIQDDVDYKCNETITVNNNGPKLVTLQVGQIVPSRNFKFIAEGLTGIKFKNESILYVEKKNASLFIQTDKAIYKPGETIRFRVLVLNHLLQPVNVNKGDLLVYFTDAQGNRVKQWKDITVVKGVFSEELKLSDLPLLGEWTIAVSYENEEKKKSVEVAEYVLPKFDVTIDSQSQFSARKGKIRAIIRSKYTYGKLVKGEAIVSLTQSNNYDCYSSSSDASAIIKTIKVDGKGTVEFDVDEDIRPDFKDYCNKYTYDLKAVVIEELTGLNQSATKEIKLHKSLYKFDLIRKESSFKPGLPIKFTLVIKYHDDTLVPVNENTKEVVILYSYTLYKDKNETDFIYKFNFNENGTVDVSIPTSNRDKSSFEIKAKFDDEEERVGWFYPIEEIEIAEFGVKILKTPVIGKPIYAEIESKESLTEFTYQVVSRGKIIRAETVQVPDRKYHVIEFPATFDLAPKATIFVYSFRDGKIQWAHTDIELKDELKNYVKLKLSTTKTKPGTSVDIDVHTNPHSYVGLLGVDQSVLLLKMNTDLNKADAFNEMEKYSTELHPQSQFREYDSWHQYSSIFEEHQLTVFTNSKDVQDTIVYNEMEYVLNDALEYDSPGFLPIRGPISKGAEEIIEVSIDENAAPAIRKEFPDTWLWQSITDDNFNGSLTIEKTVPDTITSWVITAFSINPDTGLGLIKQSKILEVFQPFFVSLNLPYSVKRGEVVTVPIVVFNYLENDAVTEVRLHNDDQDFEFVDTDNNDESKKPNDTIRKKTITVSANNGASTSYVIRPTKVGPISIKVIAVSDLASDGIDQILPVEPEGVPQYVNKPFFVDLRDGSSLESSLSAEIPETAVPDSTKVEVNCVGDILGGTIKNLHSLIRIPSGCGEQNMLNFVPNIVILNYLNASQQLKPEIEKRAKRYTESGYQRQLTYRHNNGSFSAFGKADQNGSTWLTAFVAKSFRQAANHIDIEESVIAKALKWLSQQQAIDGSFPEVGKVIHKDMQGGSGHGVSLTSYVLTTFLENKLKHPEYQEIIDKAIANIEKNLKDVDDAYALSLGAYALQLANRESKVNVLQRFTEKTVTKDGLKWWRKSNLSPNSKDSKSINVEITSYGLLTLLDANQFNEAFPYFNWLIKQRNSQGGFAGTQDTVLGLQALAKFSERISNKDTNIHIVTSAENTNETHLSVNTENALVFQSAELPSSVRLLNIKAAGKGLALVQLSYRYNVNSTEASSGFTLKSELQHGQTAGQLKLEVCSSYDAKDNKDKESNMAVLEISLPSGYTYEKNILASLLKVKNVKKIETKNGDTTVVVYFDSLSEKVICLTITAFQSHKVAEQKPASILLYDYYDNSRIARSFYSLPQPRS